MILKQLKNGDFFTLKDLDSPKESQVWIKGNYDHSKKKYECQHFSDISDCKYLKSNREVFTSFIF